MTIVILPGIQGHHHEFIHERPITSVIDVGGPIMARKPSPRRKVI